MTAEELLRRYEVGDTEFSGLESLNDDYLNS